MSAEERRAAQLERLQTTSDRNLWAEYLTEPEAEYVLDDFLAFFDETEPAVANAIRFGLLPELECQEKRREHHCLCVNYPDQP